jgi:hypothetical protein
LEATVAELSASGDAAMMPKTAIGGRGSSSSSNQQPIVIKLDWTTGLLISLLQIALVLLFCGTSLQRGRYA